MIEELYNPKPSFLSGAGLSLTCFLPESRCKDYLLYRRAIETGLVEKDLSYHVMESTGLGLIHITSGNLQFITYPSGEACHLSGEKPFLFDCRYPHRIAAGGMAEYEILYFDGHSCPFFRERILKGAPYLQFQGSAAFFPEILPLFRKSSLTDLMEHALLTTLLLSISFETDTQPARIPAYLQEMKTELESHYYRKHSLEEFEQKYHVNRFQICRDFKQYFQMPPMQFLHSTRVRAAQNLLLETNMKIHEISYEIGYESTNHFIHHFRRHTGKTPAEYRSHGK